MSETPTSNKSKLLAWLADKKQLVAAGSGFLADAYDLFVIGNVMLIMKKLYGANTAYETFISTGALVGAVIGQLFFGILCDCLGRKVVAITTIFLVVFGSIASAFVFDDVFNTTIFLWLGLCRLVLGIGVGGEYPLSATLGSESSTDKEYRDTRVSFVFSMQGVGYLLSCIVILLSLLILPNNLDIVWRIALGFGALPSIVAFVLRITMHETKEFQQVKQQQQSLLAETWKKIKLIYTEHKIDLLGTAGGWLIFDITFYGNSLFLPTIVDIMGLGGATDNYGQIMNSALVSAVTSSMALPGYIVAALTIRKLGRKNMQMLGFGVLALLYVVMGVFYAQLKAIPWLFIVMYGMTFFFSNFGPNVSTYVLPAVTYQADIRASCSGISAAAGKIGAVIGTSIFGPMVKYVGIGDTLSLCGCIAIFGLIWTYFFVRKSTLEERTARKQLQQQQPEEEEEEVVAAVEEQQDLIKADV